MFEHLKVIIKNKSQFLVKAKIFLVLTLKLFKKSVNFSIKMQSRSVGKAKI